MSASILSVDDPDVRAFLAMHLVPTDIRHDYTLQRAFKWVIEQLRNGNQFLAGDLEREVVFRCCMRNPKVMEPNVMGNALHMRSVFRECIPMAWDRGITKIMVWTQYPALASIVERLGFTREGHFPRSHMVGDTMQDMSVYSLERPE